MYQLLPWVITLDSKQVKIRNVGVCLLITYCVLLGFERDRSLLAQIEFPRLFEDVMNDTVRLSAEEREALRKVDVPLAKEKEYGDSIFSGFKNQLATQGISISDKNRDAKYLMALANRVKPLLQNARRYPQLRIYVVDSPDVDARSIPGGILIFYRGLFESAESEAALIGIVGHELSHLDRRHQLKPLQQQELAQQQFQRMATQGQFNPRDFFDFGKLSMNSFHPFHPDEEAEADLDAVVWMYQLGYQPTELGKLFQRLAPGNRPGAEFMPSFLRMHPPFPERSAKVTEETARLQQIEPRLDLIIGRDELKRRSPAKLPKGR